MSSALLLRYTVENRPPYVCNPYWLFICVYPSDYYLISTECKSCASSQGSLLEEMLNYYFGLVEQLRDHMLTPGWGGDGLGGGRGVQKKQVRRWDPVKLVKRYWYSKDELWQGVNTKTGNWDTQETMKVIREHRRVALMIRLHEMYPNVP